jgi:peptidoglycan/xylan/chitin deacetylase (PgdA/CDA1 family)
MRGDGMMKRDMAARLLATPGVRRLVAAALPHDGVLVLNYHRVGDSSRSRYDRGLWSATAEGFDAQVAFLKENCDVIGVNDIADALRRPNGRYVAITFDDGYLDNHDIALPVLRYRRVPAAFFIATGFIDRKLLPWWDAIAMQVRESSSASIDLAPWMPGPIVLGTHREASIRRIIATYKDLPAGQTALFRARLADETGLEAPETVEGQWMDWDMVRALARAGMTIGGHTVNHPILSSLPMDEQRAEIEGCAQRLGEELGIGMTHFAYPVGGPTTFDNDTMRLLREAGVRQAFSFYGGVARAASAQLDLQRVPVSQDTSQDLFRAMVQLPQMFCRQLAA